MYWFVWNMSQRTTVAQGTITVNNWRVQDRVQESEEHGCSSVILLRPKMGVEPPKHDVISMPTQQYTNINYISIIL